MTATAQANPEILLEKELCTRIKQDLPKSVFARRPSRALWYLPNLAIIIVGTWAILSFDLAWHFKLALALIVGHTYGTNGFLAHEVLHGASLKSKPMQNFLGSIGFIPYFVSPDLWRVWHNQIHHSKTNRGDRDPDSFGTYYIYKRIRLARIVARLAPGSRKIISILFLTYWFAFHGQIILWFQYKYLKEFKKLNRRKAKFHSFLGLLFWLILAWISGPQNIIFTCIIPFMVGNFILMSYIATNHLMRPLTATNETLDNSMSVKVPKIVDFFHLNFSHHIEHHLFPRMAGCNAPEVKAWLLEHQKDRYVSPSHWKAVMYLYKTPRVYKDRNTLIHPPTDQQINITDITQALS